MNQEKIGKFIQEQRKKKFLTQEELASKLSITYKAVSKWECGVSLPDPSIMLDLCNILDISLNELFAGEKIDKEDIIKTSEENIINITTENKIKNNKNKKINIILISIIIILVFCVSISITNKDTKRMYSIIFSISYNKTECVPYNLIVYNDGTYVLYTAYEGCKEGTLCDSNLRYRKPIYGTYDYDVLKIVSSSKEFQPKDNLEYNLFMGPYYISKKGYEYQYSVSSNNEYLKEFLNLLDIDLTTCADTLYREDNNDYVTLD